VAQQFLRPGTKSRFFARQCGDQRAPRTYSATLSLAAAAALSAVKATLCSLFSRACRAHVYGTFVRDAHDSAPLHLQRLHDVRVVVGLEAPFRTSVRRYRCKLADCVWRVLFSGARQPDWLRSVHGLPTESDSRVRHAHRVRRLRLVLSGRDATLELGALVRLPLCCRTVCFLGKTPGIGSLPHLFAHARCHP
jgi:hypothetical protein